MINIYNEDCLEAIKKIEDNTYDLAIVDPPYGIGMDGGNIGYKGFNSFEKKGWDKEIPKKEYFNELFRISKNQIIWGGITLDYLRRDVFWFGIKEKGFIIERMRNAN